VAFNRFHGGESPAAGGRQREVAYGRENLEALHVSDLGKVVELRQFDKLANKVRR